MIQKVLGDYRSLQKAKADVDSEIVTANSLLLKEQSYNTELLKAVTLLVSSEKRDKSFLRKLLDQLGSILKAVTNPNVIATIATMIVLVRKL